MEGGVQERIDLEHGHPLRARADLHDLVVGPDVTLLQDAEIEAGPAVRDKQRGHLRLVHANADPIASDARLRHFEQCIADSIAIADADLPVGETVDGEVFAELAKDEVIAAELALPIAVGLN